MGFGAGVTELEGHWVFSSGLMVLLHLRSSTGGFRCALPDGVRSLEWDYLRLNPLENPWWITLSRFKAFSVAGVSPFWCCGCREGVYGRSWGLSEALQRGLGGLFQPSGAGWGVGCGRREHSLVWNQETGGGGGPQVELLPGARFRISAGAWGSGLVGRSSGFPDHPGGPQFIWGLGPGISALEPPAPLRKSALSTRAGLLKKKFPFFLKRLLGYWNDVFHGLCSNYFVSVRVHFRTKPLK